MYLKHYLKYGQQIHSLEFVGVLDEYRINRISATVLGNDIKKKYEQTYDSISTVKDSIKNKHCFLTISGPQVLIKESPKNSNHLDALRNTFPNLDLDSVYYQIWEFENKLLIAIARKGFVNKVIANFSDNAIQVIGITLSFFSVQNILEWIDHKTIPLGNFTIEHTGGKSEQIRKYNNDILPVTFNIQDETIKSSFLTPFAGIFNYFTDQSLLISNVQKRNKELYRQYIEQIFFKKFFTISFGILSIVLLINYFLFYSYYNQYQELEDRKTTIEENNNVYLLLKNEKNEKLQLIENIKSNANSRVIYRLNQFVTERPDDINFSEMIFQPIISNIVANNPIDLNENTLLIKGATKHDVAFTEWLVKLEKMDWVKSVKVSDFENNRNDSNFALVIHTSNDTKK